jgi:hypothetical protein
MRQNRRDSYKRREGQSKENNYYHHSRDHHQSKEKAWIKPTSKPQSVHDANRSYLGERDGKYLERTYTAGNAGRRKI